MSTGRFERGLIELFGHCERIHLGSPWIEELLCFADRPRPGGVLVVSSGLAKWSLHQSTKGFLRQELMIVQESTVDRKLVGALLLSVAKELADRGHALKRGEVLGPAGPLLPGSEMTALFATLPPFVAAERYMYVDPPPPMMGIWLVPLSDKEAARAKMVPWTEFVEYLADLEENQQPVWGLLRST